MANILTGSIETRSIDFVPLDERKGKTWHQGPFWFSGNFVLTTLVTGFAGPLFGISVGWSILAIVAGVMFGTFFMAFHANQGPRLGLPQMIQSRAQFGSRGAIIPFGATVFVYLGFLTFNVILLSDIVALFVPLPRTVAGILVGLVILMIATYGHHLLHSVQRVMSVVLITLFLVLTIAALYLPQAAAAPSGSWSTTGFLLQFSLAAGYNISYSVYVSDYSRYLPADVSAPKIISWTYAGAAMSAIWLMSLGSLLASKLGDGDAVSIVLNLGNGVIPGLGVFAVIVCAIALVMISSVNSYGAMLTLLSAIDGIRPIRQPRRRHRVITLSVVVALGVIIALVVPASYLDSFNDFVTMMLYFLVPWTSINLADFYFVRKGKYDIPEFFNPNGTYGRWGANGIISYAIGFLAMVPFFSTTFYTGFAADLIGGDVSFAIGLFASGIAYLILARKGKVGGADHDSAQRMPAHSLTSD